MATVVQHPILGPMAWDDEMVWWLGEVELAPGQRIEVVVEYGNYDESEGEIAGRFATARDWVDRVRHRLPAYRRWLAIHLVDRRWNRIDPMTPEDIELLLRLRSIECQHDGTARLNWDDDDVLFAGHNVVTWLGPDGECVSGGMDNGRTRH